MTIPQDFQSVIQTLGNLPAHGPILLAHVAFHSVANPDQNAAVVQKLGQQAMQLKVFTYMRAGLSSDQMANKTVGYKNRVVLRQ